MTLSFPVTPPCTSWSPTPSTRLSTISTRPRLTLSWPTRSVQTFSTSTDRWELFWDGPGGNGWTLSQAGNPTNTLVVRFQAHVTVGASGSYYNEIFVDITSGCTAPVPLRNSGVTSNSEYCSSYSWPTGGSVVPMYDIRAGAGSRVGQGNVSLGTSSTPSALESWHVESK